MYLGNIHSMSLVPVTFGNFFFFKFSKNGTFWAKLRRVKMAWTFLPSSAQFFHFKNWCIITSRKKCSLTLALSCAEQVVKLPLFSKKCIFWVEKVHFIQKCSVTQNTVFQYVKNIFLLSQKKLIFFTELNLAILIYKLYLYITKNCHFIVIGHFTYPSLHKVLLYYDTVTLHNTRAVLTGAGVVSVVAALKRCHSCVSAVCCHNYLSVSSGNTV